MKKVKMIFKTVYSVSTIYQLKNTKLRKSILVLVLYTLFLNFSLALSFIKMKSFDPTILYKNIYQDISEDFVEKLPNCYVNNDLQLICDSKDIFIQEFKDFNFIVNTKEDNHINNNKTNIVFLKDSIQIFSKDETVSYFLNYKNFKNFAFKDYKDYEAKYVINDISNRLFVSVKPYILLPLLFSVYILLIIFNIIFQIGLAGIGILLNLNNAKLKFKELLNIVIFSSTLPTILTFFVSFFISPIFGVVIYNFSLALFFLYAYKNAIKGNFS